MGHPEMKFRHTLAASVALIPVALLSTPAFAQSTGSVDFDDEIVVTGSTARDVAGIQSPATSKAKSVLGQEVIARQNPGQTLLRSEEHTSELQSLIPTPYARYRL